MTPPPARRGNAGRGRTGGCGWPGAQDETARRLFSIRHDFRPNLPPNAVGTDEIQYALSTEFVASTPLLAQQPHLESRLRTRFAGAYVESVSTGIILSGWAPFNSERTTLNNTDETARHLAADSDMIDMVMADLNRLRFLDGESSTMDSA